MPWYIFALASAIFFASQELLMRVLAIKTNSPRIFSVMFNLWGALFALIAFVLQGGSFMGLRALPLSQYMLIATSGVAYGLYERYQFSARKDIDASSFSVISSMTTVMAFIGAIFFLRESLTIAKALGTALIVCASLLLVYKNPKLKLNRGMWYAFLCVIFLGITGVVDKPASVHLQPALFSFLVWFFPIVIIAFPGVTASDVRKELHIGGWKAVLAAILNVVGYILYIRAFALADASRVIPVSATSGILVVLGGILLLGEHDHMKRKLIAGALAFAGVYFLK